MWPAGFVQKNARQGQFLGTIPGVRTGKSAFPVIGVPPAGKELQQAAGFYGRAEIEKALRRQKREPAVFVARGGLFSLALYDQGDSISFQSRWKGAAGLWCTFPPRVQG